MHRFNTTDRNFINQYPVQEDIPIGIRLYALQIVRDIESVNFNCVYANLSDKNIVHNLVLIESEQEKSSEEKIHKLLERFWKEELLNVLIIFHWHNAVQIATYNPFAANKFVYFDVNETDHGRLFYDKTSNLNGYTLNATVFYDETRATYDKSNLTDAAALGGADGLLTQLIVQYMNASLKLIVPTDYIGIGEFFDNGTANGCLGLLVRGEANFGVNVRFYRLGQFKTSVEATVTNGRDDICILVPRAGKVTDIGNIFRTFSRYDWIVIAVSWPAYAIIYKFVDTALSRRHNRPRQTMMTILFDFLAMNLTQPTNIMPANWLKKSIIGFWLVYALLITSMYQSMLSGSLVVLKDLPDINSIEQLDRSHFKLISLPRYNLQIMDFLRDPHFNTSLRHLPKRVVNVSEKQFYAEINKNNRTVAYANKYHISVYIRRTHRENSGEVIYNLMKQCPVPYVTVYGLTYGSPYKGRINYIIQQAQEGGLTEKWGRIDQIKEKISQSKLRGDHELVAFSFHHLRTAFFVFLLGCLVSIGVFLLEMSVDLRRLCCDSWHFHRT